MEKQTENLFRKKFSILNSQEHSEEIQWSSSSTSEYDDTSINNKSCIQVHKTRVLKRKRKKKVPMNISNLSITILDTSRDANEVICKDKSPILGSTVHQKSASTSPILKRSRSFNKGNTVSSSMLTSRTIHLKSPILVPKTASPKSAIKVQKKLFGIESLNKNGVNSDKQNINIKQKIFSGLLIKEEPESEKFTSESVNNEEVNENSLLNENTSNAKMELAKRVKSFFDSHFSSENTSQISQNSISEVSTPKSNSKTSEEIEIFTCKTQIQIPNINHNSAESKQNSANNSESSIYDFNKNTKKICYKKDSHAYRLNKLLQKQNASVSLWQHERFLAANSNFIIPEGEFTIFRILNVNIKYGCLLVESVDANDELFLILINSCYVLESVVCESVLKLYEPYKIVPYSSNCKLITNVTRFECNSIKC